MGHSCMDGVVVELSLCGAHVSESRCPGGPGVACGLSPLALGVPFLPVDGHCVPGLAHLFFGLSGPLFIIFLIQSFTHLLLFCSFIQQMLTECILCLALWQCWGHPSEADGHGPTSRSFWTSTQPSLAQCASHCDGRGKDRRQHSLAWGLVVHVLCHQLTGHREQGGLQKSEACRRKSETHRRALSPPMGALREGSSLQVLTGLHK